MVVFAGIPVVVVLDSVVVVCGKEEVVDVVVVDCSVVVVSSVEVVADGKGSLVKNSGCTIAHPVLSMFHASMKQVPPPFS